MGEYREHTVGMATVAMVPVAEYLATSYRPDREYIDGELRERTLGETPHAGIQAWVAGIFNNNKKEWGFRGYTEPRVQVSETRFRVPDVCAMRTGLAPGRIIRTPPRMCLEILSPGDTLSGMQEKVDDYLAMGVDDIWILDPVRKLAWTADHDGIHPVRGETFQLIGTPAAISLGALYAELDDIEAGL